VIARVALAAGVVVLTACAARAPIRPSGAAVPDPTALDAFVQATRSCGGLQTVTTEMRLSGRVGRERMRGTLLSGLAAPASLRFEAVAPFGPPVFILAGRDNRATLLLPRDNRVLLEAAVPEVLERLTGLSLGANDLRVILTGCLVEQPTPTDGRRWANGWRGVTVGREIIAYLRDVSGQPVVAAADHGQWRIDYADHLNGWPRQVRIRNAEADNTGAPSAVTIDLTARLEQLEINTGIDEKAFVVDPPPGAIPITLDDLRAIAPLRGSN
jgi:outer membrane biogenesis lipoprotein LolB